MKVISEVLKPCPFCGGKAKDRIYDPGGGIEISIRCSVFHCKAHTNPIEICTPGDGIIVLKVNVTTLKDLLEAYDKAVDQWNTRQP